MLVQGGSVADQDKAPDQSESPSADAAPKAGLYGAEYVGSGTFVIKKPKRNKRKTRQTQLKNPPRGSRK
jgi:hypothetical protein